MKNENDYEKYLLQIGKVIKAARKARGEKQETVAKAIRLSEETISQIENGKYPSLKYTTIIDLCTYLEIPLNELPVPNIQLLNS